MEWVVQQAAHLTQLYVNGKHIPNSRADLPDLEQRRCSAELLERK